MDFNKYKDRHIFCSFSGGKTSGYMSYLLKNSGLENVVYVFANTGQEREETLEFVEECDKRFDLGVVWVEPVVRHGVKKSSDFKVVDFKTATRDGSLFEEVVKKYGVPNRAYPHCTYHLKTSPMRRYMRRIWGLWGIKYHTAIGIRWDEMDRVSEQFVEKRYMYPLIDFKITKEDVNEFWDKQPFTLTLQEHQGNCTWCWKKSLKKHMMLIGENPEIYDVPRYLEEQYSMSKGDRRRVFFRENNSVEDLFEMYKSKHEFEEDDLFLGCQETCEPFGNE